MSAQRAAQGGVRDPRVQSAIEELEQLILARWPDATFTVAPGEDDAGMTHLWVTVDVADTEEITDAVIDRLVELQVDEEVPIAVIPIRPAGRVLAEQRQQRPRWIQAHDDAVALASR